MQTKPLTLQPISTLDIRNDLRSIRRMLVAAAISPRFCASLLKDPDQAVRGGFGGEQFSISDATRHVLACVQVTTLAEFIEQVDVNLSNRLLTPEYIGTDQ
jgi:hypothetical protein